MSRKLVAYFSASGVTKKLAKRISKRLQKRITRNWPKEIYTDEFKLDE